MKYLFLAVFLVVFPLDAFCLKVSTHQYLNQHVFDFEVGREVNDLIMASGVLPQGISTVVNSKKAQDWLELGGKYEDEPGTGPIYSLAGQFIDHRYTNHFHNPNKPVEDAGFSGLLGGTVADGNSALLWAQYPIGEQEQGGPYSWRDAREYYFTALTATNPGLQGPLFAKAFRSVGQVMHLMQDMSVPAHTRDDFHVLRNYEDRIKERENDRDFSNLIDPSSLNLSSIQSLTLLEPESLGMVPIANLFDRKLYGATVPQNTVQSVVGLAEFTNANFVSADTIETSPDLPSPDINGSCVSRKNVLIPDPLNNDALVPRPYHWKTWDCVPGGENGYLLAGVGYFEFYQEGLPGELLDGIIPQPIAPMDNRVYDGYADYLLPRAAGYSAVLLKYFFRGTMEISGIDFTNAVGKIGMLQFTVENTTPNEDMTGGELVVSYSYKDAEDKVIRGLSETIPAGDLPSDGTKKTYIAYLNEYIPVGAKEIEYTLVYRGELGYEWDAVVGKVMNILRPVWEEHWDKGLRGNHAWQYTGVELPGIDAARGGFSNEVVPGSGVLFKQNTRPAGVNVGHVNETVLILPTPVPVSSKTVVNVKLDTMVANPMLPLQVGCKDNPWEIPSSQVIEFYFEQSDGPVLSCHYTVEGHHGITLYRTVNPGHHTIDNLYSILEHHGPISEPVTLRRIDIRQKYFSLCNDITTDQTQSMAVDYIRILDEI